MKLLRRCAGQSMPEYLIACGVLVAALLMPWNGEVSVGTQLLGSIRGYLRMCVYLLSLI